MYAGKKNFANSDGWSLKKNKFIQRFAPIPIVPLISVKSNKAIMPKYATYPHRIILR